MFADYVYFSDNLKRYYPNIYSELVVSFQNWRID